MAGLTARQQSRRSRLGSALLLGLLALIAGAAADGCDSSCVHLCDDCTADQVLAAMAAAPGESMVQQNGAHAISTKRPATTFDDKQTQQAIAMVLEAMVRFPDEVTLQSLSCGAVHALAYHPDGKHSWNNKRALALAGGIAPVSDAIERHRFGPGSKGVEHYCPGALKAIEEASKELNEQELEL